MTRWLPQAEVSELSKSYRWAEYAARDKTHDQIVDRQVAWQMKAT